MRKNPRRLWQSIQKVCCNNGQKLDTDLTPNDFAAFFEKKVEDIRASTSNAPLPRIQSTVLSLITTFGATTSEQVARLISAAPTKHCTLYPIPSWLLKDCVEELSPFLTDLFNASILVTAEVSPALKWTIITPLLKKPTLDAETSRATDRYQIFLSFPRF